MLINKYVVFLLKMLECWGVLPSFSY